MVSVSATLDSCLRPGYLSEALLQGSPKQPDCFLSITGQPSTLKSQLRDLSMQDLLCRRWRTYPCLVLLSTFVSHTFQPPTLTKSPRNPSELGENAWKDTRGCSLITSFLWNVENISSSGSSARFGNPSARRTGLRVVESNKSSNTLSPA